ncbi:MAG: M20/M25/M40 family metallo-hydrolase [Bacteroidota bacterium]
MAAFLAFLFISFFSINTLASTPFEEPVDTATVSKIKEEGLKRSKVMETLGELVDLYGPRLTGSPEHYRSAQWAKNKLAGLGLENAHLDAWGPFGKAWSLKNFHTTVLEPHAFPVVSYPKAWSPGTDGTERGEVIYANPSTDSALQTLKGKLKGKFVLLDEPRAVGPNFKPRAVRETEQSLLDMANADFPAPRAPRERSEERRAEQRKAALIDYELMEMCKKEGALALLSASSYDGGNIMVLSSRVTSHPDTPASSRYRAFENKSPKILPQVAVAAEHYNRMYRMLERGLKVKMEMNLDVAFGKADSSYNVIAEIPGTDLKDEIVMIGAHLDSWHGSTGTNDNGTGVATCIEVMRILKAIDLKPRRTIRIGLWSGEEQGLFGSRAYVKKHLGDKVTKDSVSSVVLTEQGERFSVYFNNDNGTGKVRGVYLQGNESVRTIFRKWLKPFESMDASTLTLTNTGSTDHLPFDGIGIPAFQFIQDDIEYFNLTWHSTSDTFERAIEEDLMQTSVIMATFAYNAAMRDEKLPRKP